MNGILTSHKQDAFGHLQHTFHNDLLIKLLLWVGTGFVAEVNIVYRALATKHLQDPLLYVCQFAAYP